MGMKILIVDDDPSILLVLKKCLSGAGYEVMSATNGADALHILLSQGPSLMITDWMMPGMTGLELCRAVHSTEGIGFVYVIVLTSLSDKEHVVEAFAAGANDCVSKPFHHGELLARVEAGIRIINLETDVAKQNRKIHKVNAELALLNSKLERMATTDELTGLANRRYAMRQLETYWSAAERHDQPFRRYAGYLRHHGGDIHHGYPVPGKQVLGACRGGLLGA